MSSLRLFSVVLLALNAYAQTHTASELGKEVVNAGLDANECYRVRDLEINEEEAVIVLTEGYLMF